jgi:hypothetical protein
MATTSTRTASRPDAVLPTEKVAESRGSLLR